MATLEIKADQLIAEAEKKLTPFSFFHLFFNRASKVEHAIECYQRAGNLLKVSKNWMKAADCFTKSAELNLEIDNRYEAAINHINSAMCYKKFNPHNAIDSLSKAIEILTGMGRFVIAAKHHQNIAEIYEYQLFDMKNAVNHYEQASEYFRLEENNASAEICLLKIAHYAAMFEDYQRAIEVYHQIALVHIGGTCFKFNLQLYLFKAALCHLCGDILSGKHVLNKYVELFPNFKESNEYKFLIEVVESIEADDFNRFLTAKVTFFRTFRCDELVKTLTTRIEKILSNGIDLC